MNLTRTKFAKLIKLVSVIVIILLIAGYIAFRSLPYLRGPDILVFQPVNGISTASTTIDIVGQAVRVNSLSLNGNPIEVDESGNFKETLIVFRGMNIITFSATDQFQRTVSRQLKIFGIENF